VRAVVLNAVELGRFEMDDFAQLGEVIMMTERRRRRDDDEKGKPT
jgi:hypothetical protein